jgi:hypothetical protein
MKLKFVSIPVKFDNNYYIFNKTFGFLYSIKEQQNIKPLLSLKAEIYRDKLDNPFLFRSQIERAKHVNVHFIYKIYGYLLTKITFLFFFGGFVFSKLAKRKFTNASDALAYFRENIQPSKQDGLCLSRSLFAAATSKKFINNGVLIIGVFLPSNSLHAWIIENDQIADDLDDIWINYQPVAMIYYE